MLLCDWNNWSVFGSEGYRLNNHKYTSPSKNVRLLPPGKTRKLWLSTGTSLLRQSFALFFQFAKTGQTNACSIENGMDRENIHKMPCVAYVQSALRSRMILISTSNSSIYCAQFIFIMCILSCFWRCSCGVFSWSNGTGVYQYSQRPF